MNIFMLDLQSSTQLGRHRYHLQILQKVHEHHRAYRQGVGHSKEVRHTQ